MIQYEPLNLLLADVNTIRLLDPLPPELVALSDPASDSLISRSHLLSSLMYDTSTLAVALSTLEKTHIHCFLVRDNSNNVCGVLDGEIIMGEKPYQIMRDNRIARDEVKLSGIMTPLTDCLFLDSTILKHSRIGHVVKTLIDHRKHFAFVIDSQAETQLPNITGMFSLAHIEKQLHHPIGDIMESAKGVSDLL